jgi:pyridoxamine 5'-phosphate oxidase
MNDGRAQPLRRADLVDDPLQQFRLWFDEARGAVEVPEAMAIATATPDGAPSVRMVLLKSFDARGFAFHTGYVSRKARELDANARAALLFHWRPLGRQVRVEGRVEKVAREESDAYFKTRAPGARLSALASRQSEPVASRDELEARVAELREAHGDDPPLPEHWGGYRVVPAAWEFWQHRDDRLHDRFAYLRDGGSWRIVRLQP